MRKQYNFLYNFIKDILNNIQIKLAVLVIFNNNVKEEELKVSTKFCIILYDKSIILHNKFSHKTKLNIAKITDYQKNKIKSFLF